MALGRELSDFVDAFVTGFELVPSKDEREERKATTRLRKAQALSLEADTTPEALARRNREAEASVAHTEADTRRLEATTTPQAIELERRETEAGIAGTEAATSLNTENARGQRLENEKAENLQNRIREGVSRRLGGASTRAVDAAPTTDASQYRGAIGSIESAGSGDYGAVGPTHPEMGRALGRYQVMETNVGPWTKEALGREMTPDEFLADPAGQDTVFDYKFGEYLKKTNSPQDAASMWFTGLPQTQGGNKQDALGTTGNEYVGKFDTAVGSAQAAIDRMDGSKESLIRSAHGAAKAGLEFAMTGTGADQNTGVADPNTQKAQAAYLKGAGAADPELVEKAQNVVKGLLGEREVSPAELNLYTLAATYDAYIDAGEPEKAKAVAASLMQFYRRGHSQYMSVAQAAAQKGDIDKAISAAVKAYAFVPDGYEVSVTKDTDENGKETGRYVLRSEEISTGKARLDVLLTPDELMAKVMQINPFDIESYILSAAGERASTTSEAYQTAVSGGAVDYANMTLDEAKQARLILDAEDTGTGGAADFEDLEKVSEHVTTAFETRLAAMTPEGAEPVSLPPKDVVELQTIAQYVYEGGGVNADDAVGAVLSMTTVDPANPTTVNFEAAETEDGSYLVRFKNGLGITLPPEVFTRIAVYRGERAKEAEAERAEAAKPGFMERRFGTAIPGMGGDGTPSAVPAPPPTFAPFRGRAASAVPQSPTGFVPFRQRRAVSP